MRRNSMCAALGAVVVAIVALVALSGCESPFDSSPTSWLTDGPPLPARPGAHVWAVGLPEAVVMSSDGGATWTTSHRASSGDLTQLLMSVAFCDSDHGWAVGRNGTILATTDGGATWKRQRPGRFERVYRVVSTDPRHAWALAEVEVPARETPLAEGEMMLPERFTVLFSTTDGGATWKKRRFGVWVGIADIAFSDPSHGWVVGSRPTGGAVDDHFEDVILATADGGAHWTEQFSEVAKGEPTFSAIAFSDSHHGLAVGPSRIMGTRDGGARWTTQLSGEAGRLVDVAYPDADHAWAVGNGILATNDGGATWTAQDSGYPSDPKHALGLQAVAFSDAQHGWIVFGKVALLATSDGGATWTTVRPTNDIIYAVDAVDSATAK